jgi:hypothetical protein
MPAAAGLLNIPVAIMRQLKAAGCEGFLRNGNVDLRQAMTWLITKGQSFVPEVNLERARAQLAQARAKQIERENQEKNGLMESTETQARALKLIMQWWVTALPQICFEVQAKAKTDNWTDFAETLERKLHFACEATVCSVAVSCDLPDWAIEAVRKGVQTRYKPDPERFSGMMEAMQEIQKAIVAQ